MREIKFRGKRIDNGDWVYGYYFINPFSTNQHHIITAETEHILKIREVIPETIGQFTGLKDSKGVEIYEESKVRGFSEFTALSYEGIVGFNKGCYVIVNKNGTKFPLVNCPVVEIIEDPNPELTKEA